MGDIFIMSEKEIKRKAILDGVLEGKLTLLEASSRLEISYRHCKRLKKRYVEEGTQGLLHKNRGKPPANSYAQDFKQEALGLYKSKYMGFGPTFAREKLNEDDGINVPSDTLRRWLLAANLITKQRKRKKYRALRQRKDSFGDLLQIDGSIHQWFHNDDTYYCLLNMVDDATGTTMAQLGKGETTELLFKTLKLWIKQYGIPKAVYVDLKCTYVSPGRQQITYTESKYDYMSEFERVCQKLGIEVIKAYSAQAKGRVERKHRVFQDRLVKEIELYNLDDINKVNKYLLNIFIPKINDKFAYAIEPNKNSHRDSKVFGDLEQVICCEYKRKLKNNWSIQFNNEHYQLAKSTAKLLQPKDTITIRKYTNGKLKLWFKDQPLEFIRLENKPPPASKVKPSLKENTYKPISTHKAVRLNKHKLPWDKGKPSRDWLKLG
jgi:transposase